MRRSALRWCALSLSQKKPWPCGVKRPEMRCVVAAALLVLSTLCLALVLLAPSEAVWRVRSTSSATAGAANGGPKAIAALTTPRAVPTAQQAAPLIQQATGPSPKPAHESAPRVPTSTQALEASALLRTHERSAPWDGNWKGSPWPHTQRFSFARPSAASRVASNAALRADGGRCHGRGVYSPQLQECRCTAGWDGRFCELRFQRSCNAAVGGGSTNRDALCAGNCDDDRGLCYCAGLRSPFQRQLPHHCAPWAHKSTKLPDGRPDTQSRMHTDSGRWPT